MPAAAAHREQFFNFYDDRILDGRWMQQPNADAIQQFFRMLAVCHTVIPDGEPPRRPAAATACRGVLPQHLAGTCAAAGKAASFSPWGRWALLAVAAAASAASHMHMMHHHQQQRQHGMRTHQHMHTWPPPAQTTSHQAAPTPAHTGPVDPFQIKYEAESPDEAALVVAAKFGFFFCKRTSTTSTVRKDLPEGSYMVNYELLNILEFNSTRKRMSVVIRDPEGKLLL
jgi:hypothetical protein